MKKTIFASLAGGLILFVWSFLAWVVLPLHQSSIKTIPNEDAVMSMLQQSLTTKSVYIFPANPGMKADPAVMAAWEQKMKQGPTGMLMYNPAGEDPMMPNQMIFGFILDVFAAMLAAWFLSRSTAVASSYFARVAYCGMLGIFVSVFTHLMNWNWMGTPADFTTGLIVDSIISWILAGLAIAAIIKSPAQQSA
jgi:hypothetical protein